MSRNKDVITLLVLGGYRHMGDLFPAFRGIKKNQNIFFAQAISQVPLIQNNMPASHIWGGHILNFLTTRLSSFLA